MDQGSYSRAYANGTVWLNDLFVAKASKSRLWRTEIRLGPMDILAITFLALVFCFIFYGFARVLLLLPGMDRIVEPFLIALIGLMPAWYFGRRATSASPYARRTGEGIGAYLFVKADTKSYLLGRLIGRRVAVNHCVTMVGGKRRHVECVEWLGTARAPMMPRYDPDASRPGQSDEIGAAVMDVHLVPSNVPTAWVDELRRRQRQQNSWMDRSVS